MSKAGRSWPFLESNKRRRPTVFSENSLPTINEVSRTPTPSKDAVTHNGSVANSKTSPNTTSIKDRLIKSVTAFKINKRQTGANKINGKTSSKRQGDVLTQSQTMPVRRGSLPEILSSSSYNPFRRPGDQRRSSVTGMLQLGGLKDKQKTKKLVDLSISEKYEKGQLNRRASIAAISLARRTSFGTIGSKITAILKAKNAFTKLKIRAMDRNKEGDIDDDSFEIKELPEKPRFASTLSAEAQYAMMKGYEDVVYSNICSQYPEYRTVLRRNKTPHTGIKVKIQDNPDDENSFKEEKNDMSNLDYYDGSTQNVDAPADTSTPTDVSRPEYLTSPRISERNASPRSPSHRKGNAVSSTHDHPARVMTYRYQSAMDILDTLRERQGLYRLSPRKTSTTIVSPVKEYNSWSNVWSHEFEPDKCSNSVAKV